MTPITPVIRGVMMPEDKMIAFCGLICNECPAYIAKRTNNDEIRKETAAKWSSEDFPLKVEDINCDGCTTEDELMKFCMICEVRKCGLEKGVQNCARCTDYSCEKLEKLWGFLHTPQSKEVLDGVRTL
jgi:hypothetical protein